MDQQRLKYSVYHYGIGATSCGISITKSLNKLEKIRISLVSKSYWKIVCFFCSLSIFYADNARIRIYNFHFNSIFLMKVWNTGPRYHSLSSHACVVNRTGHMSIVPGWNLNIMNRNIFHIIEIETINISCHTFANYHYSCHQPTSECMRAESLSIIMIYIYQGMEGIWGS